MDLNTVTEVISPAGTGHWRPGDAWLGGGTALFGEPRPHVRRLLDLTTAGWPPLVPLPDGGLEIAATCTIAELAAHDNPVRELVRGCCAAFLASFKIQHVATVGGNLCASLPAGPMITLGAALDAECLLLGPDGERRVPVAAFVTGDGVNVLRDGELLRSIHIGTDALASRCALRQGSLHTHGRSAVLLAARRTREGSLIVTVTAATARPYQLRFPEIPDSDVLAVALTERIPDDAYLDDVHGSAAWRRHLTRVYAERLRQELAA